MEFKTERLFGDTGIVLILGPWINMSGRCDKNYREALHIMCIFELCTARAISLSFKVVSDYAIP
jgi:hypothetical protein